ncbi:MAG: RNA methyltransferase [Planctomycetota bacterium]
MSSAPRIRPIIHPITDPADPVLDPWRDVFGEADGRTVHVDKGLRARGYFVAEGDTVVRRLLQSNFDVRAVLAKATKVEALRDVLRGEVFQASQADMRVITGYDFHRGALAVGTATLPPVPETLDGWVVALSGINDPENLGALIRIAAAFGCSAVVLDDACHDPFYRRVIRVSMGHIFHVPVYASADLPGWIVRQTVPTFAADLRADAVELRSLAPVGAGVIVLGSEFAGVPEDVAAVCDRRVMIPMAGGVDSLNVSIAGAVFLHWLAG